jgi:Na+-driven multidrug efflux pump
MLSGNFVYVVNTAFAGHLGDEAELAGVGMANMFVNILCLSVIYGLNETLNTFVSQSYGLGDYRMCGVFHNRSRIVMTLIYIPLSVMLSQTEAFFDLAGFDPAAAHNSQVYINYLIPGLYLAGLVDSNRRLLICMGYQYAPMII